MKKNIFLTFDDGPTEATTSILNILKQLSIQATFFVVGKGAECHPEILQRIHQEGHQIGNHGYTHSYLASLTGALRGEIKKTEEIVLRISGIRTVLFRPPWGIRGPLLKYSLRNLEYRVVLWDCDGKDWESRVSSQDIARRILSCVRANSVILFHDGCEGKKNCNRAQTVLALPLILRGLSAQGYRYMLL